MAVIPESKVFARDDRSATTSSCSPNTIAAAVSITLNVTLLISVLVYFCVRRCQKKSRSGPADTWPEVSKNSPSSHPTRNCCSASCPLRLSVELPAQQCLHHKLLPTGRLSQEPPSSQALPSQVTSPRTSAQQATIQQPFPQYDSTSRASIPAVSPISAVSLVPVGATSKVKKDPLQPSTTRSSSISKRSLIQDLTKPQSQSKSITLVVVAQLRKNRCKHHRCSSTSRVASECNDTTWPVNCFREPIRCRARSESSLVPKIQQLHERLLHFVIHAS